MPVRLRQPYNGQAVNTLYWTTAAEELSMCASGVADDQVELASDYAQGERTVVSPTANVGRNALVYNMMSASAQVLTVPPTGFYVIGTIITVIQWGTGATTIAAGTGVTIALGNGNTTLVTKGQNYIAQLIKSGPNSWIAFGGLSG